MQNRKTFCSTFKKNKIKRFLDTYVNKTWKKILNYSKIQIEVLRKINQLIKHIIVLGAFLKRSCG